LNHAVGGIIDLPSLLWHNQKIKCFDGNEYA
jgi:hypothetical protein